MWLWLDFPCLSLWCFWFLNYLRKLLNASTLIRENSSTFANILNSYDFTIKCNSSLGSLNLQFIKSWFRWFAVISITTVVIIFITDNFFDSLIFFLIEILKTTLNFLLLGIKIFIIVLNILFLVTFIIFLFQTL